MNIKNALLLLRYPRILFRKFSSYHESRHDADWDHALATLLDADVPIQVISSSEAKIGNTLLYIRDISEAGEARINHDNT